MCYHYIYDILYIWIQVQRDVLIIIRDSFADTKNDQQIATKIKLTLDSTYPQSTYHVIVGTHYTSSITYETNSMLFVNINDRNILVFKSVE